MLARVSQRLWDFIGFFTGKKKPPEGGLRGVRYCSYYCGSAEPPPNHNNKKYGDNNKRKR